MARNPYFQFKQFRIVQERSAMKVGVDGVLVGAWANGKGTRRILDIGSGTGLIALMMAQRNPLARVDAIEIDPDAFDECVFNIGQSPWKERVEAICCSFQDFVNDCSFKYDLIVSNPPYFSNGMKAPVLSRSKARHADSLPLDELLAGISSLLAKGAKTALILPAESLSEVKCLADQHQLFLSRLCTVKPNPVKPAFRILVEMTNIACPVVEEELMIEFEEHFDYTPAYRELTREFYLKFD